MTTTAANPVVRGYSDLAAAYDAPANLESCWGISADEIVGGIDLRPTYRTVADIGCGTGQALAALAARAPGRVEMLGVDPAPRMRERAAQRTSRFPNVSVLDGTFENIPIDSGSIDYLYSIYAFHWATDPNRGAAEIERVLRATAELDLWFVGPENGHEFDRVTTPIMRKYTGRPYTLADATMQRRISREQALALFADALGREGLTVEESRRTYYDTLEGHWGWVRIEGHFSRVPEDERAAFDAEVRDAIQGLSTERGIPYTIHQLHVKLRRPSNWE